MSTTTLDELFAPQSLTLWDVVLAQVERVKRYQPPSSIQH